MQIIRDRRIVNDEFVHVAGDAALPVDGPVIIEWTRWKSERERLEAHEGAVGVRLSIELHTRELLDDLPHLAVVAVEFPSFTDGRGYSIARTLRDRHGYVGELRAVGDVLRDQLFYMERCGFNAFELAAGKNMESALEAFGEYTVAYRRDAHRIRPVS